MTDDRVQDDQVADAAPDGPGPAEIVMYVSGVILLIASFLPLLRTEQDTPDNDLGLGAIFGSFLQTEWTTWSNAFSIFPMVSLPVLCVLVLVGGRALGRFTDTSLPQSLGGFPQPVLRIVAAAFGLVAIAAQVIRTLIDATGDADDDSLLIGPGGWLAIIALAAIIVTATMEDRPDSVEPGQRRRPDSRATTTTMFGVGGIAVATFLDVWSFPGSGMFSSSGDTGTSAWGEGPRPVYLVPLLLAVLCAAATAVDSRSDDGRAVLGVGLSRWRVLLGGMTLFAVLALAVGNPVFGPFGSFIGDGFGLYLMVVAAGAVLVGTLLGPSSAATDAPSASA